MLLRSGDPVNHVKAAIIESTKDLAAREALARFPGRYFQVAAETVVDPDDRSAVLWRVVELYGEAVEQMTRRNDKAAAELAATQRTPLYVVPTPRHAPK